MTKKNELIIEVNKIAEILKESMLCQSKYIACHKCDKPYCCRGQKRIEITNIEFENMMPMITEEQIARAMHYIENGKRELFGNKVYDCPFNDPTTGKCEIYENRFVVCAAHGVISDNVEGCNTEIDTKGTLIINPLNTVSIAINKSEESKYYLKYLSESEPIDILDAFRKHYGKQ